jgi:flavin-dependent dehydrogenase
MALHSSAPVLESVSRSAFWKAFWKVCCTLMMKAPKLSQNFFHLEGIKVSRSSPKSVADSFSSFSQDEGTDFALQDGSRVAVIGGGPAGSFFSFFLLKMAEAIDLDVQVDIYEPRSFSHCGPAGCNHCGGIVSESLVQILAAEGINLPPSVVQRAIESYVVHMDVGSVSIESPARESRIAALYRGNGPRTSENLPWDSFDGFLQDIAVGKGARVVRKLITGVDWIDGLPHLLESGGRSISYDLVTVATGVNSNFLQLLKEPPAEISLPETTRTYICEFRSSQEEVQRLLGDSMHVFLLDIARLEFAAIIPKGEFVTMVMLGDEIDQELVHEFLNSPVVRQCFPADLTPCVCTCSPLINMGGMKRPYADRLVLIGDSGVTRLYKDGIGAAFRTAKAAASTAVFQGISAEAFRKHYWPACKAIDSDNAIGKIIFAFTTIFKHSRISRRAIFRMTSREQEREGGRHMSSVLWNMFTGSAPYREIFLRTFHPGFIAGLLWNLLLGVWPPAAKKKEA